MPRTEQNARLTVRVPPETVEWLESVAVGSHMRLSPFLAAALVIGAKQLEIIMNAANIARNAGVQEAAMKAAGGIPGVMDAP